MSNAYHTPVRNPASSDIAPVGQWPDLTDALLPVFSFGILAALALVAGHARLFAANFRSFDHVSKSMEDPSTQNVLLEVTPLKSQPKPSVIPSRGVAALSTHQLKLHHGTFHMIAIDVFHDMLLLLRNAKWKIANEKRELFTRNEQLPYLSLLPEDDVEEVWDRILTDVFPDPSHRRSRADGVAIGHDLFLASNIPDILLSLDRANAFLVQSLSSLGVRRTERPHLFPFEDCAGYTDPSQRVQPYVTLTTVMELNRLVLAWPADMGQTLLHAMSNIAQVLRDQNRYPAFAEFVGFHVAYHLLRQGCNLQLSQDARFLGTVGFRKDAQTYVSLTDPGEGHIFGTTRQSSWMKGAIVHVEHLERPQNLSRSCIESYRIPSILDFARTRLHTGRGAPTTYFVGRALRDSAAGSFEHDFVKVVNTTAAAASAAFQLGAAECKVAMDGLSAREMVRYMRALAAHAMRSHRQYFSAAFNLNGPLVDDLALGGPRILLEQMDIGRRAVELAALGGFNKVTWDGAADTYPSRCIMDQLGFQNGLELVHRAHSAGLITYMSAGFKFHNIKDAVVTGVDGIGIGGAQILRCMDGVSGMHGPYMEENIDRIIAERDEAERTTRGRGALLLTRLDQMHFEGSISTHEEQLREPLYEVLHAANEEHIHAILSSTTACNVLAMPIDDEQPWLGRAHRILRAPDPLLRRGAAGLAYGQAVWEDFIASLRGLIREGDEDGLYVYSLAGPWKELRDAYRTVVGEAGPVAGDLHVGLKV